MTSPIVSCERCPREFELTAADIALGRDLSRGGQEIGWLCDGCTQLEVEEMQRLEAEHEAEGWE